MSVCPKRTLASTGNGSPKTGEAGRGLTTGAAFEPGQPETRHGATWSCRVRGFVNQENLTQMKGWRNSQAPTRGFRFAVSHSEGNQNSASLGLSVKDGLSVVRRPFSTSQTLRSRLASQHGMPKGMQPEKTPCERYRKQNHWFPRLHIGKSGVAQVTVVDHRQFNDSHDCSGQVTSRSH